MGGRGGHRGIEAKPESARGDGERALYLIEPSVVQLEALVLALGVVPVGSLRRTGLKPQSGQNVHEESPFWRCEVEATARNGREDTRQKIVLGQQEGSRPRSRRSKKKKNGCQGASPSGVSGVMGGPGVLRRIMLSEDPVRALVQALRKSPPDKFRGQM